MDYLTKEFKSFVAKPYSDDGSLFDWFLFIGMLTAMTILWTRVIRRLVD
jgi:hypothetical protein